MEDGAVVEGNAMFAGAAHWILPVFRSVGEPDEVGYADGGLIGKERAVHLAGGGVNHGTRLRRGARSTRFGCRGRFGGTGLSRRQRCGHQECAKNYKCS